MTAATGGGGVVDCFGFCLRFQPCLALTLQVRRHDLASELSICRSLPRPSWSWTGQTTLQEGVALGPKCKIVSRRAVLSLGGCCLTLGITTQTRRLLCHALKLGRGSRVREHTMTFLHELFCSL